MTEDMIFNQLDRVRNGTLRVFEWCGEEAARTVPEGFNNSILWHLGHIFTVQERWAFHLLDLPMALPDNFPALFGNGTRPADWQHPAPSLEELQTLLKQQPGRIRAALTGRLQESLPKPFYGADSTPVGEALLRGLFHEKEHFGFIQALKKKV